MSKWFKFGIVGMLLVGALAGASALVIGGVALAQDETPTTPTTPQTDQAGPGGLRDSVRQAGAEAAAAALGMTVDEMNAQLWGGKTLADLAEEQGVAIADVQTAVQAAVEAARQDAMRTAIETALTNGTITQEHADWLLEGLDKGFIGNGAFGGLSGKFGGFDGFSGGSMGRGHHGGFGVPFGGGLEQPPAQAPSEAPTTAPSTGG